MEDCLTLYLINATEASSWNSCAYVSLGKTVSGFGGWKHVCMPVPWVGSAVILR